MLRFIPASAGNRTVARIPEWLKTDHPREVIEAALAHVVCNRVEAASARSDPDTFGAQNPAIFDAH